MLDRVWWFLTGLLAGGFLTVRALRRTPAPGDLRAATAQAGAEALDLASRFVRPPRRG